MAKDRSRFFHLERERDTSRGMSSSLDAEALERFKAVDPPHSVPKTATDGIPEVAKDASESANPRFTSDVPRQDPSIPAGNLDVERRDPKDQPFVRCARCEADNTIYAKACWQCMTELDTDEQRFFNDAFWRKRLAAVEEEREYLAGRKQSAENDAVQAAEAKRELGVLLAEEVRRQTLARLESDPQWLDPQWSPTARASLGRRALRRIKNPRARIITLAFAILLPVLLLSIARIGSRPWTFGLIWSICLAYAFMPAGRRRF